MVAAVGVRLPLAFSIEVRVKLAVAETGLVGIARERTTAVLTIGAVVALVVKQAIGG